MTFSSRKLLLVFLFFFLIALDISTKYAVHETLPLISPSASSFPYGGISIFENLGGIDFAIVHAINTGAAYSIFSQYRLSLLLLRMGLIAALFFYLGFVNQRQSWQIPLVLITAGACGNVIDFFLYGHVVDMFQFIFWGVPFAIFNIADAAISIGIVWLFVSAFLQKEEQKA